MDFATRAIHSGGLAESEAGDVAPPIHLASIYAYSEPGVMQAGYEYIRYGNPTRSALESCLGALEKSESPALCFSSGQAAIDCALRLLRPGDSLLAAQDMYGGTARLTEEILRPMGIEVRYANAADAKAFCAEITPQTRMVWLETPSNPLLRVTDVPTIAEAARKAGALTAVDSTFGTPFFQNPLDWGADIVMHSTTKYLGGHSDLLGGALVLANPALRAKLYETQKVTGAVASPFDCWLTLRGIRTLAARMRVHAENALQVAQWLEAHPCVQRVYYPGLASHPEHECARRLMRGFGGMVSFEVTGGEESAKKVLQNTRLFLLAASLGGVESIISYPPLMSHAAMSREARHARGILDGCLRLSVGLESAEDLIADLDQALAVL